MLHELVFLGFHSQLVSYPYMFVSYSYSWKILQSYVAATIRMHSDAVLSSTDALLKATFHLTISMRGQRATCKIQRNHYHHESCGPF